MHQSFFKMAAVIGFSLTLIASLAFFGLGRSLWAFGSLTAACWAFLNIYFLYRIFQISFKSAPSEGVGLSRNLLALSFLKFPVIYLTGFFILKTRFFPMESILVGLTLFMTAVGVSWAWHQRKTQVGLLSALVFFCLAAPVVLASEASHGESHSSGGHDEHSSALHTTNLVGLVGHFLPESAAKSVAGFENVFFGVLVIAILSLLFYAASRNKQMIPGRLQAACEAVVEGLDAFVCGIIGPEGRKFTPFLGTLFLYILTMNLLGLIPLMKSNTANSMTLSGPVALPVPTTTVALALIVFVTVQAIGIKKQGLLGYLDHMAGSPRDVFGFVMAPLMFPIHLIGELAKPFSLTFRLFCNTMGGHVLVAVFIGMGVASLLIPFQAPFLLFEIATSTIQAFVFMLLSTVYIAMMLPHGDHQKHSHEAQAH